MQSCRCNCLALQTSDSFIILFGKAVLLEPIVNSLLKGDYGWVMEEVLKLWPKLLGVTVPIVSNLDVVRQPTTNNLYKPPCCGSDRLMETPKATDLAEQTANALGLSQLAPALYQDLLQPAARETGKNILLVARAVSLGLSPLNATVWGFEQIGDFLKAKITAKLARKPPEEIQGPARVIAGPVVMGMVFAAEEPHLREMYANLLATAMHGPSAGTAHPSFVQTIQQLSADEARILQEISKKHTSAKPIFEQEADPDRIKPEMGIPERWRRFCGNCGIQQGSLADAYCENLIRLGILGKPDSARSKSSASAIGYRVVTTHRLVVTRYGDFFLDVCVRVV